MAGILADNQIAREFDKNGFVKIPFLSAQQLMALKELFDRYCVSAANATGEIYYSAFDNSIADNLIINDGIKQILSESYGRLFTGYEAYAAMFFSKGKGEKELFLHQDWSYTEEAEKFVATIWCPLADTDVDSGCLFAIPGSHRFFKNYRSANLPTGRVALDDEMKTAVVNIALQAGEAVLFHPALFHGSHPNRRPQQRVVAANLIVEPGEKLSYFNATGEGLINQHVLSEKEFFTSLLDLSTQKAAPTGPVLQTIAYQHTMVNRQMLLDKCDGAWRNAFGL